MLPERLHKGATLIVDGQARWPDGRPFDLTGWEAVLVLKEPSGARHEIQGGVLQADLGKFQFTLGRDFTASLPLGTLDYQVLLRSPNDTYVVEEGMIDVVPTL